MITLNSTYSLIAKMGEAMATTQPDYVVFYGKPLIRREQGTATEVRSHEVGRGTMNSTTNVTLLANTTVGTNDRYVVDAVTICNRDTIAHTIHVSIYDGTTETRIYNNLSLPVDYTLRIGDDGTSLISNEAAAATSSPQALGAGTLGSLATLYTAAGTIQNAAIIISNPLDTRETVELHLISGAIDITLFENAAFRAGQTKIVRGFGMALNDYIQGASSGALNWGLVGESQ